MTTEAEILQLSLDKFRWKTTGQIDSIEDLFDNELVFINITGQVTTKAEWIKQLRSKNFVYNKIDQQEASVKVYADTAVLVGKADFIVNGGSVYNSSTPKFIQRKTINGSW